jgi:hypothetical protein
MDFQKIIPIFEKWYTGVEGAELPLLYRGSTK